METRIQIQERQSRTNQLVFHHRKVIWFRPEWNEIDQMESYWRRSTKKKQPKVDMFWLFKLHSLERHLYETPNLFFHFAWTRIQIKLRQEQHVVKPWSKTPRKSAGRKQNEHSKRRQRTAAINWCKRLAICLLAVAPQDEQNTWNNQNGLVLTESNSIKKWSLLDWYVT